MTMVFLLFDPRALRAAASAGFEAVGAEAACGKMREETALVGTETVSWKTLKTLEREVVWRLV